MKKRYYVLISLLLVFVALSVRQYINLNRQQRKETAVFINKQIILCGKSIEDAIINFEESVKFEFANRELQYFFDTNTYNLDSEIHSKYIENDIKRIRRFYSNNQVLISKITIFNQSTFRSFERTKNNYFLVTPPQKFLQKVDLIVQPNFVETDSLLTYTQPIRNARGEVVANAQFDLKIQDFFSFHFEKFYIGKNSWYWAINQNGKILFNKYSEPVAIDTFETNVLDEFRLKLKENLSVSLQHTIWSYQEVNAYSVFYPVNILGKNFGIVFSVNTDTLYKKQNESNIAIFIYFLLVIAGIITLFSIIIRQMVAAQKQLESSDAMLRTANQASEILLTDPDFDSSVHHFLEITARAMGYHRAFILEYVQNENNNVCHLKYEWNDTSAVKPLAVEIPEVVNGMETILFQNILTELKQNKIVKQNENEFSDSLKVFMQKLQCRAFVNMPVYVDESMYGVVGFMDCSGARQWQEFEDALFVNFANAVGGALSIQKKKDELIEAKNVAEKANKAKSEFLASMSHEIRTPMNAILGFSEILFNNAGDPKSKSFLHRILTSGRTLLYLINDILDLSKIEAGQMEIFNEPTRIADVFVEMNKIFSTKLAEKNLEFRIRVSPDFPEIILIDDIRLRQILFNLVGNAVKFTETGFVELSAHAQPVEGTNALFDVEFSVADSGIGIPASHQKAIFDAFVQVESSNTRKYGGTGLGLAITTKLVTMMRGKILLESELNKGSKFTLVFSGLEATTQMPERKNIFEWSNKEVIFDKGTILVVDDVDYNRELAKNYLSAFNFSILEAKSGSESITMAQLHKPNLILMDLRMPGMSGYEASEELKKIEETKGIKCIAFTASSMRHDETVIKKYFIDYLLKPITRNELIDCLMRHLPHQITELATSEREIVLSEQETIPEHIKTNPQILNLIAEQLEENVLKDVSKLLLTLDPDVFMALESKISTLAIKYDMKTFLPIIEQLRESSDNFDFEVFNENIQKMNKLVQEIILLSKTHIQ